MLQACLTEGTWPQRTLDALIDRALHDNPFQASAATRALFGIVIERLGDLFEPELCEIYARLFSHVIARVLPAYDARELLIRYGRIRQAPPFAGGEVNRVFVLSRVTLGADVAVTSVALNAAKQRFPNAEIWFLGPPKNAEMFAADERVIAVPIEYGRSSLLRDRLAAAVELQTLVDETASVVIDPDSRMTQLGLIPICDDSRYYFFESRAFGGEMDAPLPQLTAAWLRQVFDVENARAYVAPAVQQRIADVTVSLGVGDNEAKRLDDEFERRLLEALLARGRPILIDRGAGGEEAERVDRLVDTLGHPALLHIHVGSYASFASHIVQSKLYVGYDSAGQHVANAAGIPLVSVFTGYVCLRMLARWRPAGPLSHIVVVDQANRDTALDRTLDAIAEAAAEESAGPRDWPNSSPAS